MLPSTFCKNSKNVRVKTSLYLCIKDIQQAGLCILSKYGGSSLILQSGGVQMSVEFDVEQQQHMTSLCCFLFSKKHIMKIYAWKLKPRYTRTTFMKLVL